MPTKKPTATPRRKPLPKSWPATQVSSRQVSKLLVWARNARTHTKDQIKKVAASIEEWGWTTPVLITPRNQIIAGHCRVLAAELLGIEDVPVMIARGWSEDQMRAYVIADNQLAAAAGWDKDLLRLEVADLAEVSFDLDLLGFDDMALERLTRPLLDDLATVGSYVRGGRTRALVAVADAVWAVRRCPTDHMRAKALERAYEALDALAEVEKR